MYTLQEIKRMVGNCSTEDELLKLCVIVNDLKKSFSLRELSDIGTIVYTRMKELT